MQSDDSQPNDIGTRIRDAFLRAIDRRAESADGEIADKLQMIADSMVDKASAGDLAAGKEVLDRLGGRPQQANPLVNPGDGKVTLAWDDAFQSATGPDSNSSRSTAAASASPAS
jgi:hypothetical protein